MKRLTVAVCILLCLLLLAACGKDSESENAVQTTTPNASSTEETNMKLFIGETEVPVTWEQNESVTALQALTGGDGLTISMSMYGGFEQVGSIGQSLPRHDEQMKTASGDIVLYSGNQIVLFYGSNSWSYTRLGHVNLSTSEMTELLSNGNVTIRVTEG